MKSCPYCGKRFNWWQRAVGENKEHIRMCCESISASGKEGMANICRGCPAGCFEKVYDSKDKR